MGIAILSLMSISYEIKPALVGKVTTALQVATVFFALLYKVVTHDFEYYWITWLFWGTAFFTFSSGVVYILRGIRILNKSAPEEAKK
jgi:cardiolipin synthase